jgi:membrane-associated phospholipid phosphatase
MKKILANAISILFHPMLMPVFGLFLIFHSGTHLSFIPLGFKRMAYTIVFASSCLLPLSLLPLLHQFKLIKSFKMETHRERILPVFITGVFYFLGYLLLKKLQLPLFFYQFILGSLLAIYAALVITLKWKISLHMVGIGGVTGAITALSLKMGLGVTPLLMIPFVVAALLASARLYLNAHTPLQVYLGFLLGHVTVLMVPLI